MALMLALLLCVSAFVSGSETAFFSLTSAQIREMKESRQQSSETIIQLLTHSDRLLATILICNNLVNICITIISARIVDLMFVFQSATWTFVFKTVCVTFLLLLFGEILPKVLANSNPLRVARFAAGPLSVLNAIVKPLASILVRTGGSISNRFEAKRDNLSIDELSNAIDLASTDQTQEERKMLSGIVNFVNTDVAEIMKPRIDIVAVEISDSYSAVKEQIIKSGYSRIPVYEESADNIKGVLYVKDLIPYIHNDDSFEWVSLLRQPYYIPAHKKINDLLEEFQSAKVHLAIVVDEYGSTLGLVSLEDILEEVVGEISDESDVEESFYHRLNENTYVFEGKTHIIDMLRVLQLDDELFEDVQGRAETIAGLLLELNRNFLRKGDELSSHGIRFIVTAKRL